MGSQDLDFSETQQRPMLLFPEGKIALWLSLNIQMLSADELSKLVAVANKCEVGRLIDNLKKRSQEIIKKRVRLPNIYTK